MVSARKVRLEKAARKGDRTAKKALELAQNPGKFLSTVQIGITLIGILTGIYSGEKIQDDLVHFLNGFAVLQPYSETIAVSVIVVTLTFFSLVLGELVPKRIGLTMPETISRVLSYPMYWISILTAPFIWLLTATSDLLIKILNIKASDESYVTEEEIKAMIQEGAETGVVQEIEQDIVENVFHLGDRKIKSLMTLRQDMEWLNLEDSPEVIKKKIIESEHKLFPVCRGEINKVEGMLHSKDLLDSLLRNDVFDIEKMAKPVMYLSNNATAYKALENFRQSKDRVAMVVDEYGSIQGVLSVNDLVDALIGDLEKQLHETKEIIPRKDGSYLVDAGLSLSDFTRYFDIDMSEDESISNISTVGGFMIYTGRGNLHVGYNLTWKNLTMEIVDMDGRRIDKILVYEVE